MSRGAKANAGCKELKAAIIDLIDWDQLTTRDSPALFKRLKEAIVRLKAEGRVLMRFNKLREALTLRMSRIAIESFNGEPEATTSASTDASGLPLNAIPSAATKLLSSRAREEVETHNYLFSCPPFSCSSPVNRKRKDRKMFDILLFFRVFRVFRG